MSLNVDYLFIFISSVCVRSVRFDYVWWSSVPITDVWCRCHSVDFHWFEQIFNKKTFRSKRQKREKILTKNFHFQNDFVRGRLDGNEEKNDECLCKETKENILGFFLCLTNSLCLGRFFLLFVMNFLDPIAKNPLPSQNRSYQIPMSDEQFHLLTRAIVHVSFVWHTEREREKKTLTKFHLGNEWSREKIGNSLSITRIFQWWTGWTHCFIDQSTQRSNEIDSHHGTCNKIFSRFVFCLFHFVFSFENRLAFDSDDLSTSSTYSRFDHSAQRSSWSVTIREKVEEKILFFLFHWFCFCFFSELWMTLIHKKEQIISLVFFLFMKIN